MRVGFKPNKTIPDAHPRFCRDETAANLVEYRDVRKIIPLLDALEQLHISVRYFALDLSRPVLVESVGRLRPMYKYVRCFALWGTFDDGLEWAKSVPGPKWYMSLGSMFGNDRFEPAVARLTAWRNIMTPQDRMLLGLDGCQDLETIWKSYHDSDGIFHAFIRNGLVHSNVILGVNWYRHEDWDVDGKIFENPLMHRFVYTARREINCEELGIKFRKGEQIGCYEGFKYTSEQVQKQFDHAKLQKLQHWLSPSGRIRKFKIHSPDVDV